MDFWQTHNLMQLYYQLSPDECRSHRIFESPINSMRQFYNAVMMLKFVNGLAPPYLTQITSKINTFWDLPILTLNCPWISNVEPVIPRIASHLVTLRSVMLCLAISKRKHLRTILKDLRLTQLFAVYQPIETLILRPILEHDLRWWNEF